MAPIERSVAILAVEQAQVLDITGPYEVFARVGRTSAVGTPAYRVELLGEQGRPIATSCGLNISIDRRYQDLRVAPDTLLVAGGRGVKTRGNSPELLQWLRRIAPGVRRLGSICTGAFLLAEAGLLNDRRATTHWASCQNLIAEYPQVRVELDPIFVQDGSLYTSAGVTTGIDLALALVEEDCGYQVALQVARDLVLFLKRPGTQSQFSAQLKVQSATLEPLRNLQAWLSDHLSDDLGVARLAKRVAMSPRHFGRLFRRELGTTPARYVELLRVEAARRHLAESSRGIDAIASLCGFGTSETMRRAFLRQVRVAPGQYRSRFRSTTRLRTVKSAWGDEG